MIQIEVVDEGTYFLPVGTVIRVGETIPASLKNQFPRRVLRHRLTLAEARLEVTLQRAKAASHTRTGSALLPAPPTVNELIELMPGRAVSLGGVSYWITESTVSWPDDTIRLDLYNPA